MTKYNIKVLQDQKGNAFLPFVTTECVFVNGEKNKNVEDLIDEEATARYKSDEAIRRSTSEVFIDIRNQLWSKASKADLADTRKGILDQVSRETSKAITEATEVILDESSKYTDNAIKGVTQFNYEVVDELPEIGVKGTIYLISNSTEGTNIYDEYIWVENKYEKIGTTEADLSNYYDKTTIDGMMNNKANKTDIPIVDETLSATSNNAVKNSSIYAGIQTAKSEAISTADTNANAMVGGAVSSMTQAIGAAYNNAKKYTDDQLAAYEETDPTVPNHVKAITEEDIAKWNEGSSGGDGPVKELADGPIWYNIADMECGLYYVKPLTGFLTDSNRVYLQTGTEGYGMAYVGLKNDIKVLYLKANEFTVYGFPTYGSVFGLNYNDEAYISANRSYYGVVRGQPVNNLTSTDIISPLSAAQGKALNDAKQDKLTAGEGITIENNVISASGGSGGTTYTTDGSITISDDNQLAINNQTYYSTSSTNDYGNSSSSARPNGYFNLCGYKPGTYYFKNSSSTSSFYHKYKTTNEASETKTSLSVGIIWNSFKIEFYKSIEDYTKKFTETTIVGRIYFYSTSNYYEKIYNIRINSSGSLYFDLISANAVSESDITSINNSILNLNQNCASLDTRVTALEQGGGESGGTITGTELGISNSTYYSPMDMNVTFEINLGERPISFSGIYYPDSKVFNIACNAPSSDQGMFRWIYNNTYVVVKGSNDGGMTYKDITFAKLADSTNAPLAEVFPMSCQIDNFDTTYMSYVFVIMVDCTVKDDNANPLIPFKDLCTVYTPEGGEVYIPSFTLIKDALLAGKTTATVGSEGLNVLLYFNDPVELFKAGELIHLNIEHDPSSSLPEKVVLIIDDGGSLRRYAYDQYNTCWRSIIRWESV